MPSSRRDFLATSDPVIRNHHFLDDTPLRFVARQAIARAISDIAAMGGGAAWILTDVVAPVAFPAVSVHKLYRTLESAAREFGLSIVGGDLSSSGTKMNTSAPFDSNTHLTIAERSSIKDKASCLSVELKKGDIRDALNLKDHPENLGMQVFLCGDIVEAYYGIPGLKSLTEYDWP